MNPLVAYFSATGTTAKAAKALAKAVNAPLYEIKPAVPYTSADLNWRDKHSPLQAWRCRTSAPVLPSQAPTLQWPDTM